jgi:hypothetical protein
MAFIKSPDSLTHPVCVTFTEVRHYLPDLPLKVSKQSILFKVKLNTIELQRIESHIYKIGIFHTDMFIQEMFAEPQAG